MRFREIFYALTPSWLRSGDGELALYSLGTMQDAMAERFRLSYEARLPTYAPEDAIPYIGRDRKIVRGLNEPVAAYAQRLIRYLDDHRVRGNPFALHAQLRAYLQTDVQIRTVDRRGNWYTTAYDGTQSFALDQANWDWDGAALSQWARFWVIIYPVGGTDPWSVPASWPTSTTLASTTATADEGAGVKSLIKQWKPAGTRCEWIIVAFDDTKFDPTDPDLGGTWGDWSTLDGTHKSRSRETTARYWVGPR